MSSCCSGSRRRFLKASLLGGLGLAEELHFSGIAHAQKKSAPAPALTTPSPPPLPAAPPARVALTTGNNRADNTFRALRTFEKEIAQAIGNKLVVLKPNNVSIDKPLCATHADHLEGILEFLKSIRKTNVVIAESPANGSAVDSFANYGYNKLAGKYGVKLVDLDKTDFDIMYCWDQSDMRPHPCRISKVMLDPNSFIVSSAILKTHLFVVATFSLKNVIVGSALKLSGTGQANKFVIHGGGTRGIHYNLTALAQRLHPHLAVIDGFEGMEGEGPVDGTPVDHRICVVSSDWLAADTVSAKLMGLDIDKVGYLKYSAQAGGLGQSDLNKIEILGPALQEHIKVYKLPANTEKLFDWQKPLSRV